MQRAKRLLDETSLPMAEIAMRAGFGSLRRFNSVFAETYGRPPSEIRRTRRSAGKAERTVEDVANESSLMLEGGHRRPSSNQKTDPASVTAGQAEVP